MLWETTYELVFWAFGKRDAVGLTLQINEYLRNLGREYMPVYLPNKEEIPLNEVSLNKVFFEIRNKKSGLLSIWLRSENGFVLDLNLDLPHYPNVHPPEVIGIGFQREHIQRSESALTFPQLQEIFTFGLKVFNPFYAFGVMGGEVNHSKEREEKGRTIDRMKVPLAIEWFNYFEPAMVERLGDVEKLLSAPVYLAQTVEKLGGVILILQEEPFDFRDPIHSQRREKVEAYLDLNRLHKLYP